MDLDPGRFVHRDSAIGSHILDAGIAQSNHDEPFERRTIRLRLHGANSSTA